MSIEELWFLVSNAGSFAFGIVTGILFRMLWEDA